MPEFAHHLRQSTKALAPVENKAQSPKGNKALTPQKDK